MDDLRAVMDAAGCERPAIFGISEGGPMSLLFAATHPERRRVAGPLRHLRADAAGAGLSRRACRAEQLDRWRELVRDEWGGPVAIELLGAERRRRRRRSNAGGRGCCGRGRARPGRSALIDLYREIDVRAVAAGDRRPDAGHAPHAATG